MTVGDTTLTGRRRCVGDPSMRGERCAAVGGDNNSDDVSALVLGDNTGDNVDASHISSVFRTVERCWNTKHCFKERS